MESIAVDVGSVSTLSDRELRSAGIVMSGIAARRIAGGRDDFLTRGELAEVLLMLGIGTELTVSGEVDHLVYRTWAMTDAARDEWAERYLLGGDDGADDGADDAA